jgi:cellobiose phosphorylase
MKAVAQRLVRRNGGLMQLFDPPFDNSLPNPGYVKGYPPGIRENGGQYTHGAVWAVMAFAQLGQIEQAWEFFNLLNPIHHASTATQSALYKVEPYVVAADIYSGQPDLVHRFRRMDVSARHRNSSRSKTRRRQIASGTACA